MRTLLRVKVEHHLLGEPSSLDITFPFDELFDLFCEITQPFCLHFGDTIFLVRLHVDIHCVIGGFRLALATVFTSGFLKHGVEIACIDIQPVVRILVLQRKAGRIGVLANGRLYNVRERRSGNVTACNSLDYPGNKIESMLTHPDVQQQTLLRLDLLAPSTAEIRLLHP